MTLPEALERAATALRAHADRIRPSNGDPVQLLDDLDGQAAAEVLAWLLAHEPEAGAELALAWAEEPEGAAPLAAIDAESLPKEGRKAMRRVQHRLRSRGIRIGSERPAAPVVARLREVEDRPEAAFVSALDPQGAQLTYLVEPNPSGGLRLFELVVDEVRGVLQFDLMSGGRGNVRRFLKHLAERPRFPAYPAEPAAVRALIERAAAGQPDARPLPRGFAEWRAPWRSEASGRPTPGEEARAALGVKEAEPALLRRAAELVKEGALGPWPPAAERLSEVGERLREQTEGRIIVSDAAQRGRVDAALGECATALFEPGFAERTAHRYEESAYALWKTGREDEARASLAAAQAFRELSPEENPVARAQVEVLMGPVLASLGGEPAEEDDQDTSLLVEP